MTTIDLRALQQPLKDQYRADPASAKLVLRATASQTDSPLRCTVDLGRGQITAEAHPMAGGPGQAPCPGDLLLGALAACAQLTCQMVAAATGVPVERITVTAEGELDMRGSMGVARDVPVGFEAIRLRVAIDAPDAPPERLARLRARTEQFCVVLQTLLAPPPITVEAVGDGAEQAGSVNSGAAGNA